MRAFAFDPVNQSTDRWISTKRAKDGEHDTVSQHPTQSLGGRGGEREFDKGPAGLGRSRKTYSTVHEMIMRTERKPKFDALVRRALRCGTFRRFRFGPRSARNKSLQCY
jgi:hypothetical protein